MDDCHTEYLDAKSLQPDEVLLGNAFYVQTSQHLFDTAPSQVVIESAEPQKLRFQLIQCLAESPNRKVKGERKRKVAETFGVSTRQVEQLLTKYYGDRLHENTRVER